MAVASNLDFWKVEFLIAGRLDGVNMRHLSNFMEISQTHRVTATDHSAPNARILQTCVIMKMTMDWGRVAFFSYQPW